MNFDRWGGLIALIANLGVVGGLVFLAVEMRHNSQVSRAEAVMVRLAGNIAAETALMGDDAVAALTTGMTSPESLTDREMVQIWAYLNVAMISVQQTYTMHRLGLATDQERVEAAKSAADWLGFSFGRVWWSALKTNFPPDLIAEVDAQLERTDPNSDYWLRQLATMREGAKGLAAP